METYGTLIEIVTELVDRGYSIDFNELEQVLYGFHKTHLVNVPPEDFLIDEVYCCDNEGETGMTYIFAVSSKKYRFKGIVINGLTNDNTSLFVGAAEKIKKGLVQMLNSVKPWIVKIKTLKNKPKT